MSKFKKMTVWIFPFANTRQKITEIVVGYKETPVIKQMKRITAVSVIGKLMSAGRAMEKAPLSGPY